jgi:hypothetical protein
MTVHRIAFFFKVTLLIFDRRCLFIKDVPIFQLGLMSRLYEPNSFAIYGSIQAWLDENMRDSSINPMGKSNHFEEMSMNQINLIYLTSSD